MSRFGKKWELPENQFLDYSVLHECFLADLFKSNAQFYHKMIPSSQTTKPEENLWKYIYLSLIMNKSLKAPKYGENGIKI